MSVTINGTTGITTPGVTNSGAETIATTLAVTGAATLGSTLAVTGATTLTGNVTLGSSLLATPSGSAPSYTCRAWVNFNGAGTVAIRGSGNVSSITDSGVGSYIVNFSSAMPDANYNSVGSCNGAGGATLQLDSSWTTTGRAILTRVGGTSVDVNEVCLSIFR